MWARDGACHGTYDGARQARVPMPHHMGGRVSCKRYSILNAFTNEMLRGSGAGVCNGCLWVHGGEWVTGISCVMHAFAHIIIIIIKGHSLRRACLQPATNTQNSKPRPPTTNICIYIYVCMHLHMCTHVLHAWMPTCTQTMFTSFLQDGATPLHIAAAKCHLDVVKALVGAGANKEAANEVSRPSLQQGRCVGWGLRV